MCDDEDREIERSDEEEAILDAEYAEWCATLDAENQALRDEWAEREMRWQRATRRQIAEECIAELEYCERAGEPPQPDMFRSHYDDEWPFEK